MSFTRASVGVAAILAACGPTPPQSSQPSGPPEVQPIHLLNVDDVTVQGDVSSAAVDYAKHRIDTISGDDDFVVRKTLTGMDGNNHVRMAQVHAGVPVFGGDIVVHADGAKFLALTGNIIKNLDGFDVEPTLDAATALASAKRDYVTKVKDTSAHLAYSRETTELVILPGQSGRQAHLAWHVVFFTELQGGVTPGLWNYFYDAKTGNPLKQFNAIDTLSEASGPGGNAKVARTWVMNLDVEPSGTQFQMDTAQLQTVNMNNQTTGDGTVVVGPLDPIGDAPINDAHGFAKQTLAQLSEWQGFNSIDNAGFKIRSRVHYDVSYENAFWDGTQMTYGDGASTFFPLSGSVDVVAHEIDHGFTSFHSNLVYSDQSGGMNESFSDIAGETTEAHFKNAAPDFLVGADIFKADGALRFMCNPTQDGVSIDNAANMTPDLDPHFASGVMNKAFCLTAKRFASGSPTGDATVDSVRRASNAWYHANAAFWVASSTFVQGCQGVFDAAKSLNFTATELDAIKQSWSDVGVTCGDTTSNLPPTVSITSPGNNSTVKGVISISANATDSDGTVASVTFSLPDGTSQTSTAAPFTASWNSATVADNTGYTITAVATDNLGATSTPASIAVNVANNSTGMCVDGTFAAKGMPKNIPDNSTQGVTSSNKVTGAGNVATLTLSLHITHTFREDLKVTLISPSLTRFVVFDRQGKDADDLVFVDLPVTAFNGEPAAGIWKLKVQDLAAGDVGTLDSWSLTITGDCSGPQNWSGSSSPNVPTVDNGQVCDTLHVTAGGDAAATKLDISGVHAFRSILRGTLAHNGVTVEAFPVNTFPASSGTFTFADRGIAGITGSATGDWTLCVIDTDAFGDVGTLNSWSVHN
jgi:Zn-dependent metalloprotease/subtilisin-like proprotein convertase family protein